ncbi:MAG: Uma2 family endonuclease [Planctomycetales bacterium]|nr:Uma2 family endonuclease [Planctomycetales bacterium]
MNTPIPGPAYSPEPESLILDPEDWPSIDHIETENDEPVDNVFSEKQMRLLTEPLYSSWKPGRPFVAMANVGLFYGVDLPPLVPDALLSVDVRLPEDLFPKMNRSYMIWKYGRPPDVVIEIVSKKRGGEDSHKLAGYANARIANYFIFDPEHHLSKQTIRSFRLRQSELVLDKSGERLRVSNLGLELMLWSGRYEETDSQWLRWATTEGGLIPTGIEQADVEAKRAESEAKRAESEAKRADAAEQENAKLKALLREHGIQ